MELSADSISELRRLLTERRGLRIVIFSHYNPDGDAIGSTLAWRRVLVSMGHAVTCIIPNKYPYFLNWIEDADKILVYKESQDECKTAISEAEVMFCLDFNQISRMEGMSDIVEANASAVRVLIDHHLQPPVEQYNLLFSHPDASSTSYIVYKIIERMFGTDVIDTPMASALYVGMMTDTGNFTFSNLSPDLYRTIAVLVEKGINIPQINVEVYNSATEARLRLLSYSLGPKMEIIENGKAACISLTEKELRRFSFQPGDSEGFVNYPLSIKGVLVSAMFLQTHKFIRVSLRSRGATDVNVFARTYFDGGGHRNAAGGKSMMSMPETIEYYKRSVAEFFRQQGL